MKIFNLLLKNLEWRFIEWLKKPRYDYVEEIFDAHDRINPNNNSLNRNWFSFHPSR